MAQIHTGSFRDPSGFLYNHTGQLFRQVNLSYRDDYEALISSGLYEKLVKGHLLIPHAETADEPGLTPDRYKVIAPEVVPFISYPYEWSFSQLKDAALTTLKIQKLALQHGMTLKDATAYNIQFHKGKPVLIDTLSFERYAEGAPWAAYKQFCQHFLAPLALMSHTDIRLNQMLRIYLDGIPLDLASSLLPASTRASFLLLMHIHLHAKTQKKYEKRGTASRSVQIKRANLLAMVDSLSYMTGKFRLRTKETEWAAYYTFTNYNDQSFAHKKEIVASYTSKVGPATVWDLGANNGEFTRIPAAAGADCISFDIDPLAVEANYQRLRKEGDSRILPLVMDLTNPSPATGWNNRERMNLQQRAHPDMAMALALIHHLAISNNLPFTRIAGFLAGICRHLVIEFVPKQDSQVQKLLESRKDIFPDYDEEHFEKEFSAWFEINEKTRIRESDRVLYLMRVIEKKD